MPFNPAPSRQFVLSSVTPKVADFLFHVVWDRSRGEIPAFGTPHPNDTLFPNHRLCHYEPVDDVGDKLRLWYIAPREDQDDYNWEHAKADIGGQRFDAVTRTYVTPRNTFVTPDEAFAAYDPDAPAMGTAMPDVPEGRFSGSFVLAERKEVRSNDPKIDSLFVIDQHTYVKRTTITESNFDEVCRRNLNTTQTLYYSTEIVSGGLSMSALAALPDNAYWGLQDDGVVREWRQLSAEWYAVTEQQVVAGTFTDGVVEIATYTGNTNYSWPPVLSEIELMDWVRKDGSIEIRPRVVYDPEGYSGPCASTTAISWAKEPFAITKADQMLPTGIHYSSPYYNVNTSECLHPEIPLQCDILRAYDPVYSQNTGSSRTFEATNYTEWPATIRADDDQRPFRGGFLRTTVTITKPS